MRLSKFLIAGVLAPVVLGTNDATAEVCSGRFYVGVNVGAEFGKMKYSSKPGDQYDVVPDGLPLDRNIYTPFNEDDFPVDQVIRLKAGCMVFPIEKTHVKLPMSAKRKSGFTGGVEIGYLYETNNFGFGLEATFGKDFATRKQSVNARMVKYSGVADVAAGRSGQPQILKLEIKDVGSGYVETEESQKYSQHLVAIAGDYESATRYNTKDVTEIKLKNKFNVTITPIIEYKANPMFGIYITGGIRISNDKVTYKETDGSTKKVTNFKKTKTSIAPVVGGGVMINLTDHMYAKVQYLYQFGSKIKKTISRKINDKKNEVTPTVKYRSQKVTVGFGYMF